jgi:isocitrate dehydrogenase
VRELDNRGSHFYLALYWAEALANQTKDADLKAEFTTIAKELAEKETIIVHELNQIQGSPVDIGGYYKPNETLINQSMRPSRTFNGIID